MEQLPSSHVVRAALHVARLIDAEGNPVPAVHHGYTRHTTGGIYPPDDLRLGEDYLIAARLVEERDGYLYPFPELAELAHTTGSDATELIVSRYLEAVMPEGLSPELVLPDGAAATLDELIPDPDRREALLLSLAARFDDSWRAALGARGEEFLVEELKNELHQHGRDDLRSAVRRVSLVSDALGYDVVAPRLDGKNRRLEVKTTKTSLEHLVRIYLSRNEADVGRRDPEWALVVCAVDSEDVISVAGWCRGSALAPYLPVDAPSGGGWREAAVILPTTLLFHGMPPAI